MDGLFNIIDGGDFSVIVFFFFVVFQIGFSVLCVIQLDSIDELKRTPTVSVVLSQIWWAISAPNTSWFMAFVLLGISGCATLHVICKVMGAAINLRKVVKTLCRLS